MIPKTCYGQYIRKHGRISKRATQHSMREKKGRENSVRRLCRLDSEERKLAEMKCKQSKGKGRSRVTLALLRYSHISHSENRECTAVQCINAEEKERSCQNFTTSLPRDPAAANLGHSWKTAEVLAHSGEYRFASKSFDCARPEWNDGPHHLQSALCGCLESDHDERGQSLEPAFTTSR